MKVLHIGSKLICIVCIHAEYTLTTICIECAFGLSTSIGGLKPVWRWIASSQDLYITCDRLCKETSNKGRNNRRNIIASLRCFICDAVCNGVLYSLSPLLIIINSQVVQSMLSSVCVNLVIYYLIYTKERGYCVYFCIPDCINLEINLHIITHLYSIIFVICFQ